MHLETGTARAPHRVSAKVATATTEVDNSGNRAAIETTEGAANKEAIETTEETEVAVDVLPTVDNEVVEPSTTMIGPVPVATT